MEPKKKREIFRILILIVSLLFVENVLADTINNTNLNMTLANSSIRVRNQWTFDEIHIDPRYIYVSNLTQSHASQLTNTSPLTFNFTQENKNYFGDDFPYFSSITELTIIIKSNITSILNASTKANFSAACPGVFDYSSGQGGFSSYSYDGCGAPNNTVNITNIPLELGTNTLTFFRSSSGGGGGGGDQDQNPPSDRQDTGRGASPCDVVADSYNSCYYLDPQGTGLCLPGCPSNQECATNYRCVASTSIESPQFEQSNSIDILKGQIKNLVEGVKAGYSPENENHKAYIIMTILGVIGVASITTSRLRSKKKAKLYARNDGRS